MKMNLPSSHGRFARCGKTMTYPNGRIPQKGCSRKRKIKIKAP